MSAQASVQLREVLPECIESEPTPFPLAATCLPATIERLIIIQIHGKRLTNIRKKSISHLVAP